MTGRPMKLLSVNVGLPREVLAHGGAVTTGIFKEPIRDRATLRRLNLDGDGQADLSVHGGVDKAVYAYPVEHYDYWRGKLPEMELRFGMFGENFTTEGLLEPAVNIGDRFHIGGAEVMATQPRLPCYKLGIKFGRDDMVRRFLASGRTGFYFRVLREGEVGAGDEIQTISRDESNITVPDITRLYVTKTLSKADRQTMQRAAQLEALSESWRQYFLNRLEKTGDQSN